MRGVEVMLPLVSSLLYVMGREHEVGYVRILVKILTDLCYVNSELSQMIQLSSSAKQH